MFKKCPSCGFKWSQRDDLLSDHNIVLVGYQVNFIRKEMGLILFNHSCNGTLAVRASDFEDLYEGPLFEQKMHGTDPCPGYCLHEADFRPCPLECECTYIRNILQEIKKWPKFRRFSRTAGE